MTRVVTAFNKARSDRAASRKFPQNVRYPSSFGAFCRHKSSAQATALYDEFNLGTSSLVAKVIPKIADLAEKDLVLVFELCAAGAVKQIWWAALPTAQSRPGSMAPQQNFVELALVRSQGACKVQPAHLVDLGDGRNLLLKFERGEYVARLSRITGQLASLRSPFDEAACGPLKQSTEQQWFAKMESRVPDLDSLRVRRVLTDLVTLDTLSTQGFDASVPELCIPHAATVTPSDDLALHALEDEDDEQGVDWLADAMGALAPDFEAGCGAGEVDGESGDERADNWLGAGLLSVLELARAPLAGKPCVLAGIRSPDQGSEITCPVCLSPLFLTLLGSEVASRFEDTAQLSAFVMKALVAPACVSVCLGSCCGQRLAATFWRVALALDCVSSAAPKVAKPQRRPTVWQAMDPGSIGICV